MQHRPNARAHGNMLAALALLTGLSACKRESNTGMPVPDDPATGEVPKPAPAPMQHKKPPPLGELDPRTGDPDPNSKVGIPLNDAGHEAK